VQGKVDLNQRGQNFRGRARFARTNSSNETRSSGSSQNKSNILSHKCKKYGRHT